MDIQDFGAMGEVVGGIAVIATLIYLSIQIRQSNTSTHRQMYAQAATSISEFWLELAKDAELYQVYVRMLREPHKLGAPELGRAFLVLDSYLSLMESYFLHNQEYDEKLSQERWERILRQTLNSAGGKVYWSKRRMYFHGEFADYISGVMDSLDS